MSINYAATPTIRQDADQAAVWEPRLTLPDYDRFTQAGMVMTEKQGDSDLRANSTVAQPVGEGWYELTGHKWFCTHPVFEMFFTLAVAEGGIPASSPSARIPASGGSGSKTTWEGAASPPARSSSTTSRRASSAKRAGARE